jgi:hypothetical protein
VVPGTGYVPTNELAPKDDRYLKGFYEKNPTYRAGLSQMDRIRYLGAHVLERLLGRRLLLGDPRQGVDDGLGDLDAVATNELAPKDDRYLKGFYEKNPTYRAGLSQMDRMAGTTTVWPNGPAANLMKS